jgi:hypothetical protein
MSQPSNIIIGDWATGVWQELGSLPTISVLTISGYAYQPSTLGSLNSRIGTCYSGSGIGGTGQIFTITPDITNTEMALIDALYHITFFTQMSIANMGAGGGSTPFMSLKEGDSVITLANPAYIGKEYREMMKDWVAYLNYLVVAYKTDVQHAFVPKNVAFLNPSVGPLGYPYGNGAGVSYR